jgi:hypothetical protein
MVRRDDDNDAVVDRHEAGAFMWVVDDEGRRIIYTCPLGAGKRACAVPIHPNVLPNGASWQWDGNEEAPTLSPSINCVGGCGWHGWIQNGVMR